MSIIMHKKERSCPSRVRLHLMNLSVHLLLFFFFHCYLKLFAVT